MVILPPNPSLVAILLLIKTRHGVKHVYHYPSQPGRDPHTAPSRQNREADDHSSDSGAGGGGYSSSSESSVSSVEDSRYAQDADAALDLPTGNVSPLNDKHGTHGDIDIDESGSTSPEKIPLPNWTATKGEKELLDLPPGFPAFLCPPMEMDRKRFEMGIDQLTFLGWPCFAKEDGSWKSKRQKRRSSSKDKTEIRGGSALGSEKKMKAIDEVVEDPSSTTDLDQSNDAEVEDTTANESDESLNGMNHSHDGSRSKQETSNTTAYETTRFNTSGQSGDTLNMFHVVFVMNPPTLEYQVRVEEMYTNVVKKFSKALKREQARSNYVFKECEMLKAMKARHDPDSENVRGRSRLARAIAVLFDSISRSQIARIELTSKRSFWLQIPMATSISSLPDATEPQLPGTWLTTATAIPIHDELSTTGNKLASHFALLLLADVPSILGSVSSNSDMKSALEHYLSNATPTKSFLQVSQKSGIPLEQITLMASHMIHWRQARIIPPLHKKDVYIVSPNADMRLLKEHSRRFRDAFPMHSSLKTVLARLNSANRAYKSVIPNKDHKETYMAILAWLMRYGWVTQIRTFAWVRVSGEIRRLVGEQVEKENIEAERFEDDKANLKLKEQSNSSEDDIESEDEHNLMLSSTHSIARSSLSTPSTRSQTSIASALTAVPIHNGQGATYINGHPSLPTILLSSPTQKSGLTARYLKHISSTIEQSKGIEAREAWDRCLPFFDGEHALEQIPISIGWKRSHVESLRADWIREGWLREGKSW